MVETVGTGGSQALIGKVLAGRFLILKKVGQGGMAWVYQAMDLEKENPVAIKVLLPHLAEEPSLRERFLHEARIQKGLDHPHIVKLIDVVEHEKSAAIVMEWVEGENLKVFMKRNKPPLGDLDIWELMQPVLSAVGYAHSQGVVHRDLKPDNFLVSWQGGRPILKVTDFGVAKVLDELDNERTRTNMIMGTARYMSPEQVTDSKRVDIRADVYSIGVCIYWMATGRFPYEGNVNMLLGQILTQPPTPASERYHGLRPELEALIMQAIDKDPDKRPPTCEALAQTMFELLPKDVLEDDVTMLCPPPEREDSKPLVFDPTIHYAPTSIEVFPPKDVETGSKRMIFAVGLALLLIAGGAGFVFLGQPAKKAAKGECEQGASRVCYSGPSSHRGVGICRVGKQSCREGKWGACKGSVLAQKERCNGKDDDCDGKVDEDWKSLAQACSQGVGECKVTGAWRCNKEQTAVFCETKPLQGVKVNFQLSPSDQAFQFRVRSRAGKKTLADATGKHCLLLSNRRLRRRLRIKLSRAGYQTCTIYLKKVPKKAIQLRMKKRSKWGRAYNYCMKEVK